MASLFLEMLHKTALRTHLHTKEVSENQQWRELKVQMVELGRVSGLAPGVKLG